MDKKNIFPLNWLINACLFLVIFLVPIFFLPFTLEKVEFNKYFLFYFLVLLAFLGFLTKIVMAKEIKIKRTVLDIPLLVLWLGYFVICLFSQDRSLSFWGDFSALNLSFVGFSFLLIFFFLIVQQINTAKQVIRLFFIFLLSGFVSSLYFLLSASSLVSWTELNLPQFNLFSSSNIVFGFFQSLIFILSLGYITLKKKERWLDIFSFLALIFSLACLILFGFKLIWVITAAGLFFLAVFFISHLEKTKPLFTSLILFFLVGSLFFIFFGEPKFLTKNLPLEISLSPGLSWSIAQKTLMAGARNFIFGTGPGTYIYDFSLFRSDEMNLNFAWNIRFNQPYSTFFNWLTTNGVLTTLVFLGVILIILGFLSSVWLKYIAYNKNHKRFFEDEAKGASEEDVVSPLFFWLISCGWLLSLVSLFLINFGVAQWVIFWFLLGLVICSSAFITQNNFSYLNLSLKTTPQYALVTSFVFIILYTFLVVLGVYLARFYVAEATYNQGLSKNYEERLQYFSKALNYNPSRPQFYLGLADSFINRAGELVQNGGNSEAVSQFLISAVNAAKKATEISPKNVATWEYLSTMYSNARSLTAEANSWAISSLEKAIQLESNNPLLYISLGNSQLVEKRYSEAKTYFEKALSLKPNLLIGYLQLAALNEAQKNLPGAISIMERGLTYGVNNAEYLLYLGQYYLNSGTTKDYALAESAFKKAIVLNPNYSNALYALAYLYEKTGFKNQAVELYQRVLDLNPDNSNIIKKIESLNAVPVVSETPTSTLPIAPNKKK